MPSREFWKVRMEIHLPSIISRDHCLNIEGGSIKNLLLENVNIDLPGTDRVAPIAGVIKNNATVENVKVTGSVVGNNDVAGIVNKIDGSGKVSNVAFIGKPHAGNKGGYLAGVVGENWKGVVEKAYVDAEITGNKAKAAGLLIPLKMVEITTQ